MGFGRQRVAAFLGSGRSSRIAPEGKGTLSHSAASTADRIDVVRAGGPEQAAFITAVNRALADEAAIKSRIAVFKDGVNLTGKLALSGGTGWFTPMVHDLLRQGVSVVVNDIGLTAPGTRAVETVTGIPADWVFQHNLYITPKEVQGFLPHCDPHLVAVAQLYGRKEWFIYDKQFDNPVSIAGRKDLLVADPKKKLAVRQTITVEAGDVFVIPRGVFHAARAIDGASVHVAIGCAGIRPVDVIWQLAEEAMAQSKMRADMTPEDARTAAVRFLEETSPKMLPLPRYRPANMAAPEKPPALCCEEALGALPGR